MPSSAACTWGCMFALLAAAGAMPGCNKRSPSGEGVIVRQVLHGNDVPQETGLQTASESAGPRAQPGQVTTTLVTDTPQATYKQAADRARKQLEFDTARAALNRLDNQIEQEQESPP